MSDFLQLGFSNISQFHFIRPLWLIALLPLVALWFGKRYLGQATEWQQFLPAHLARVLLSSSRINKTQRFTALLVFWLVACVALAGPSWQKIEKPVFQIKRASVIVMDMSMSMRATDIKPDRLTKARFKALDLAEAINDGEVALVAYAGDAFTISPLTPDARNLTALLPSLTPEIMPELGSYPLSGLEKASELLSQAGYPSGDIFWLTDGIELEDQKALQDFASATPYRLNILAIGTSQGAPIKMADASLLKDHRGSIVIPKLNAKPLSRLATLTGGLFVSTTANDSDIKRLASLTPPSMDKQGKPTEESLLTGDDWQEFGPYLVLLILPFVLSWFRRGATLGWILPLFLFVQPKTAMAENEVRPLTKGNVENVQATEPSSWLDFVFNTQDQVATKQFEQGQYAQAQSNFEHNNWKGAAAYKAGDYEAAHEYFSRDTSANGWYNRGNSLAQLNRIDEAIDAYRQALRLAPEMQQAKENKELLEKLRQQQEEQDSDSNQEQNQDQQGQQEQQQQGGQQQESEQSSNSEQDSSQLGNEGEQSNSQSQNASESPEPTASESEQDAKSEQESQQGNQEQNNQQQARQQEQATKNGKQDEQATDGQRPGVTPLTPEQLAQQEQQQKIQQLLRKVTDDPATLLRNKMILENRKRQQSNRAPKGAKKQW